MATLVDTEIARRVYAKRKRDGLSLAQAAKQTGLTVSTLYRLETNAARPSLDTALSVARWLGLDVSALFRP